MYILTVFCGIDSYSSRRTPMFAPIVCDYDANVVCIVWTEICDIVLQIGNIICYKCILLKCRTSKICKTHKLKKRSLNII